MASRLSIQLWAHYQWIFVGVNLFLGGDRKLLLLHIQMPWPGEYDFRRLN